MTRMALLAAVLVMALHAPVFADDRPTTTPSKAEYPKANARKAPKETRVSITGVVKDISETMILVERTVKGKTETMEFVLEKPVEMIKAGDKVRVSYFKKEGKHIATRVSPFVAKKIIKKTPALRRTKQAPPETQPPRK